MPKVGGFSDVPQHGRIHFHDIGDYLDQKQKLAIIRDFGSIGGIAASQGWIQIEPDEHSDWLKQRDGDFDVFLRIGDKKDNQGLVLFSNYTRGLETGRDFWVFNSSRHSLTESMAKTMLQYKSDRQKLNGNPDTNMKSVVSSDPSKISWTSSLRTYLEKGVPSVYSDDPIQVALYRPFQKQFVYNEKMWIHRQGQMPRIYPSGNVPNRTIVIVGAGEAVEFSALMADRPSELKERLINAFGCAEMAA